MKVNKKEFKKAKKVVSFLILWLLMLSIHSDVFGRDVQVNVTIRQRAAQPYLYIPATFFWNNSKMKARKEKRLEEKRREAKKQREEVARRLKEFWDSQKKP